MVASRATENAGVENAGASKNSGGGNHGTRRQGWKTREKRVWKAKISTL